MARWLDSSAWSGQGADVGGMRESLTRLKVPYKTRGLSVIFGGCVPFGNGGSGIPPSSRSDACQRGFLNFASNEAGYIREHFVKAWPIHSDFRHPEPCSPRPQYRLRGGRGDAKEAGTAQPRIERPQLRPMLNAARAAFAGVGPFRRKRVAWVVAPNDGVSGQLMENVLTHLSAPPCHSERSRRIYVRLAVTPCPPTPRPFAFAQGYKRTF